MLDLNDSTIDLSSSDRIAIFSDIHWGKSKDSVIKLRSTSIFLEWFINTCREKNIDTILFLGDWFNSRTSINIATLNIAYSYLKKLNSNFKIYLIVGNHDTTLKNSIDINSVKLFKEIENVNIIEKLTVLKLKNNKEMLLYPWGCDISQIDKKYDYAAGHFEFNGACLAAGQEQVGLDINISDIAKLAKVTFTGHFHIHKDYDYNDSKIIAVGCPLELDWGDYNNDKGFYILDTNTNNYEFIKNTKTATHKKLYWSKIKSDLDIDDDEENITSNIKKIESNFRNVINTNDIKDNYIRLVIDVNYMFEEIIKVTNEINFYKPLKPCENEFIFSILNNNLLDISDTDNNFELNMSKFDYIKKYIEKLPNDVIENDNTKSSLIELANLYYKSVLCEDIDSE